MSFRCCVVPTLCRSDAVSEERVRKQKETKKGGNGRKNRIKKTVRVGAASSGDTQHPPPPCQGQGTLETILIVGLSSLSGVF